MNRANDSDSRGDSDSEGSDFSDHIENHNNQLMDAREQDAHNGKIN